MAEALPTTGELLAAVASIVEGAARTGELTRRQARLALHLLGLAQDDLAAPEPERREAVLASLGASDETELCDGLSRGRYDTDLAAVVAALRAERERSPSPRDPGRDLPGREHQC